MFFDAAVRIGVLVACAILLVVAALWLFQERLVFLPPARPAAPPPGAQRVEYTAADAQPLRAFLVGSRDTAAPLLIQFHGNADVAQTWIPWAREMLERTGWRVLLAEYRGYGGLPGRPTYAGVMHDARAAFRYAREHLGVPKSAIALYGHSLGAGVASELAADVGPRVLLLDSPPTSIVDMGRRSYPPPISWALPVISRIHFAPADRVREIDAPVWVAIGERDTVVPPDMGRRVFGRAKRAGKLLVVPDADHNSVASVGGDAYWSWITDALNGRAP